MMFVDCQSIQKRANMMDGWMDGCMYVCIYKVVPI